eukprot:1821631-Prymnesium_polylepis.1
MSQRPCSSNADRTGRKAWCQRAAHAATGTALTASTGTALTASRASARPAAASANNFCAFWAFSGGGGLSTLRPKGWTRGGHLYLGTKQEESTSSAAPEGWTTLFQQCWRHTPRVQSGSTGFLVVFLLKLSLFHRLPHSNALSPSDGAWCVLQGPPEVLHSALTIGGGRDL